MTEHKVEIGRSWPLADAMAAAALGRSCTVMLTDGDPNLRVDGRCWALPGPDDCARTRTSLVLGLIADSLLPAPSHALATIVAPAAGRCGPSGTGPIDAIRDGGSATGQTIGSRAIPWSAHTIRAQQSRCWLMHVTFDAAAAGQGAPQSTLPVLPAVVAQDTARATQYQLDRGAGAHWTEVLLLGPPNPDHGWVTVRAVHTDGVLTAYLVDRALAGARTLAGQ